MADHRRSRPFKGLILFAGIALVVTLLFAFVMSAVIPPINVPDREKLVAEINDIATHFDWRWEGRTSHPEHCQYLIEEGPTRTDTLTAFKEEFTRLDDQISMRFTLGRVHVMIGECHFNEALKPENSHAKQQYLSQGDAQLVLADQTLEDALKRVAYTLKAKRNRMYNLERARAYLTESDVQTKLSTWQAYAQCLLRHRGKQRALPDTADTPGNAAPVVHDLMFKTCRQTP